MKLGPAEQGNQGGPMMTQQQLEESLTNIDGKSYKAYKTIAGVYRYTQFELHIDHVQADPFAAMSRLRVRVPRVAAGFTADTTTNQSRRIALEDFLSRRFYHLCQKTSRSNRGIGQSGTISMEQPHQEILERSSLVVNDLHVEARFFAGLPAKGRQIDGQVACTMLCHELPIIVSESLFLSHLDQKKLYAHLMVAEDADFLRASLSSMNLVAFIGNGAILPRASGIDPHPLCRDQPVAFKSPPELEAEVALPNSGKVKGMGIPKGVTLIVGGGYHGKSTLLNAIELGIYNHIPGDGRERVVTDPAAVKIRAADGRHIEKTDISPFINNLPFNKDTVAFSTENASGSTSQAAAISEAIEAGATTLLLDEDTSATNFMIRDMRMQQLVSKDKEPITPFVDKVQYLHAEKDISTLLVMGGSGDYFSVADHVIQMDAYIPYDVTQKTKKIAAKFITGRVEEGGKQFGAIKSRIPMEKSFNSQNAAGRSKISPRGQNEILYGQTLISCWDLEQIVEIAQMRSIGYAIDYARRYMDGQRTLSDITQLVMADLENKGLDILPPFRTGDLTIFRSFELAAAINRMRTLQVRQR